MTNSVPARYAAVRHLPADQAALRLGISPRTVADYRANNPDAAYDPVPPVVRPGTVQHRVAMTAPSQSATVGPAVMVRVTLPAPPAGVTFNREGAMI